MDEAEPIGEPARLRPKARRGLHGRVRAGHHDHAPDRRREGRR
jgi:hypothetical protein